MAEKMQKVKDMADPRRCQSIIQSQGQCMYFAEEGSKFCIMHGGRHAAANKEREGLRNYRLTKFNARLQQLGDSPDIKSLRDEIAILRIIMEERLNQCADTKDLIYQSGPISDLVMKIDRVVTSCHKLEEKMGALLDKQAIIQFGSELVSLIGDEIKDEEALARIAHRIYEIIATTIGESEEDAQA
jgi:putative component of toxin-antitoxin plasmid stabilization module